MGSSGPVLIAGGGIGGVAAAVALRQVGIEAHVFERAERLGGIQVGGCYVLWYPGVLSLDVVGRAGAARAVGHDVERFELCDSDGAVIVGQDVGDRGREVGAVPLAIRRADLHRVLTDVLDDDAMHLGARLIHAEQDSEGVTAYFADGRSERGDVLVGADGINSALRAQLHGQAEPIHPGYAHWSGIAKDVDSFPRGVFRVLHGEGARFAFFHLPDNAVCWWVVRNAPAGPEGDSLGALETLKRDFARWTAPVGELLEATDPKSVHRRDTLDRPPLSTWGQGRFTLIGDAAHAMTFNLGQGAGTALTDAVTLPSYLTRGGDVVAALRDFETARSAVTTPLVRRSRWIGWMASWDWPGGPRMNASVMRLGRKTMPGLFALDLQGHPGLDGQSVSAQVQPTGGAE